MEYRYKPYAFLKCQHIFSVIVLLLLLLYIIFYNILTIYFIKDILLIEGTWFYNCWEFSKEKQSKLFLLAESGKI